VKAANLVSESVRWSDAGLCWEEKITNSTGSIEVPKYSSIRVRATGASTVTVDGTLAATMTTGEVVVYNVGDGNPDSGKQTVTVAIGAAAAYVQVGRELPRSSTSVPGSQLLFSLMTGGPTKSQIASPTSLSDNNGNVLSFTRASSKFCRKSTTFDATNLCPLPEAFASWTDDHSGVAAQTATANAAVAPDGTFSAARIDYPAVSGGGAWSIRDLGTPSVSPGKYIFSLYIKGVSSGGTIYLGEGISGQAQAVPFTTAWQRVSFAFTFASTNILVPFVGVDFRVAGTVAQPAQSVYLWGAKIEAVNVHPNANGWSTLNTSITQAATTAPDGSLTGTRIDFGATPGASARSIAYQFSAASLPAGPVTFSFYAKADTLSTLNINLQGGSNVDSTVLVGTDWALYTFTGTMASPASTAAVFGTDRLIFPSESAGPTQSIYVWGARLDVGSARLGDYASPLIVQLGNNIPPVEPEGIFFEGTATNLLLQSQDLTQGAWIKNSSVVTGAFGIAPDGSLTAARVVFTGVSNIHQSATVAATMASAGIWIRATTGTVSTLTFNIKNASLGFSVRASQALSLTTTWQRVELTATTSITSGDSIDFDITGSGNADVLIWAPQLEASYYASSYIPTTTTSASRAADILQGTLAATMTTSGRVQATIAPRYTGGGQLGADYLELMPGNQQILYQPGDLGVATVVGGQYLKPLPNFVNGVFNAYDVKWTNTTSTMAVTNAGTMLKGVFSAGSSTSGKTAVQINTSQPRDPFWIHSVAVYSR
jgi:hypothetical protein